MVYIARDGTVHQKPPWNIRLMGLIIGFFNFIAMFFKTMFGMDSNGPSSSGDTYNSRRGGGPGGGGGGGPPGGPRRRPIGRMMTLSDCTIPGGG
ncbi:glycine-rich selenoprotein-like [Toxorhynchites rutilus septentrionalis]|uniref:glycine-rich selenoprotein-like n=1 Tax=Toxorhynchites rutilus septentrionalis TaxID=329112 RepID=UPI002478413A|nr:glycine-rich selenoprotein-like [Toxorhynchites rutilus septentrionalis]